MSEDLIKTVEELLESGRGNAAELEHILKLLKENRSLPRFDRKYLEILLKKRSIIYRGSNQYKSEGTALVLSLLFGFFGFMGFGHRYVGHVVKSLAILYSGWALLFLNFMNFFPLIYSAINHQYFYYGSPFPFITQLANLLHLDSYWSYILIFTILISVPVGYLVLYIWQIFDARKITREFNLFMDGKGTQLYEMTIDKKIAFILIVLAPIIAGMIYALVRYLNLVIQSISIPH